MFLRTSGGGAEAPGRTWIGASRGLVRCEAGQRDLAPGRRRGISGG
ncbi:MAG: hypothetical protein LBE67_07570 [Kocuria palustris]|nr:hypothetical protein [Kocuria palustris]